MRVIKRIALIAVMTFAALVCSFVETVRDTVQVIRVLRS